MHGEHGSRLNFAQFVWTGNIWSVFPERCFRKMCPLCSVSILFSLLLRIYNQEDVDCLSSSLYIFAPYEIKYFLTTLIRRTSSSHRNAPAPKKFLAATALIPRRCALHHRIPWRGSPGTLGSYYVYYCESPCVHRLLSFFIVMHPSVMTIPGSYRNKKPIFLGLLLTTINDFVFDFPLRNRRYM